jgi:outer membrane protein TolC
MLRILIFTLITNISIGHAQTADLEQLEKDINDNKITQNLNDQAIGITLQDAIEDGLRKNYQELTRKYEFQLNELYFKDAHDDFYFPKLNLTMGTNADHFSENLFRDNDTNAESPKTPNGSIGLEIEDYTVFNWGKDYLDYLNAKHSYKRAKESFKESKRELRLQIIAEYFNLSRQNAIVKVYKKQLSHTSFVYRLAKEKLTLRKITSQEFFHAKSLFLDSHKNYHDSLYNYYKIQQSLAQLLGDDLKTIYKPLSILKFKPIAFGSKESYRFVTKTNPDLLDARTEMENSSRSYQKVLKENLPLPKFSLKLGSYQRGFSSGGYSDDYETFPGSKNIELAASVNMSWRIYGSGGFFNSRVTESSFYGKKITELKLREANRHAKVSNRLTHSRILHLEKKHEASLAERKNARKTFDKTIDNYLSSKTGLTNVQQILENLLTSQITFENTKYEHLLEKLTLAKLMGVDDFPGEKFDHLVVK